MRIAAAVGILVVALGAGAWLLGLPPFGARAPKEPPRPDLFAIVERGDLSALRAALGMPLDTTAPATADGAESATDASAPATGAALGDLHARNEAGLTPLMAAVTANTSADVLDTLLAAGADVDMAAANGATALMLAAGQGTPAQVIYLLNAGADPTPRDAEGRNAADHARQNPAVRSSAVSVLLAELAESTFVRGWPSGYIVPVNGATISSRRNHLPGAPRAYRNGYHEGFDFYDGTVSVEIGYGTPIQAVADGVVIRADHDYVEHTMEEYDALLVEATRVLDTPPDILDRLRGRQVWIRHAGGFVTRYAHLAQIAEGVEVGSRVRQGDIIATTGNSGTLEAAQQTQEDPHPHVEVWRGDETFLGSGMEPEEIWSLAAQVFGTAALPPYHD
jgi:murein DD-endopeptidase MepM/ murein hydrolase activator NlpD